MNLAFNQETNNNNNNNKKKNHICIKCAYKDRDT